MAVLTGKSPNKTEELSTSSIVTTYLKYLNDTLGLTHPLMHVMHVMHVMHAASSLEPSSLPVPESKLAFVELCSGEDLLSENQYLKMDTQDLFSKMREAMGFTESSSDLYLVKSVQDLRESSLNTIVLFVGKADWDCLQGSVQIGTQKIVVVPSPSWLVDEPQHKRIAWDRLKVLARQ